MAARRYYATGAFRYQTRMLQAGDPVILDGPNSRLYLAMGKVTPLAPPKNEILSGVDFCEAEPLATPEQVEKPKRRRRRAKA